MCEDLSELIGVTELAEMFGVRASAISNWAKRHNDWPDAAIILKMGAVYRLSDVSNFLKRHPNLLNPKQVGGKK
jgi:transcriptional regulator with XRE-family HTH domain